jgi:hypothetical protein
MTELQFQILNAMMDDAEDVEQIYLAANRSSLEAGSIQPEHALRAIIDELNSLLRGCYVEAPKFCNRSSLPQPPDPALLHHYWFCPTEKGRQEWAAYSRTGVQK